MLDGLISGPVSVDLPSAVVSPCGPAIGSQAPTWADWAGNLGGILERGKSK